MLDSEQPLPDCCVPLNDVDVLDGVGVAVAAGFSSFLASHWTVMEEPETPLCLWHGCESPFAITCQLYVPFFLTITHPLPFEMYSALRSPVMSFEEVSRMTTLRGALPVLFTVSFQLSSAVAVPAPNEVAMRSAAAAFDIVTTEAFRIVKCMGIDPP
jgi:hypothetical protein